MLKKQTCSSMNDVSNTSAGEGKRREDEDDGAVLPLAAPLRPQHLQLPPAIAARAAKVRRALPSTIRMCVCMCVRAGGADMRARANTGLGVCVYAIVAVVTTTQMATVVHCVRVCADNVDIRLSTNSDNLVNWWKLLPHRHGCKLEKF